MEGENQIFMIIDANNFYASCEREFNPELDGRPIIVLSNNDGCVVARSAETKALGIPMGVPLFKVKDMVKRHNIAVLSSNYELYGEMSNRFKQIIGGFVSRDELEGYSVDECFINVTAHAHNTDLNEMARQIKSTLLKWIGLPSCVGIGASKTQAKIANHIAKKNPHFNGVCNLIDMDPCITEAIYSELDVGEVWGVGRQNKKRLEMLGINTVLDLALADVRLIRKHFSVVMERTASELRGISCLSIDEREEPNKQIICSRSFDHAITELNVLKEAVTLFTLKASDKLRKQGSLCGCVGVFIKTNRFSSTEPYFSEFVNVGLTEATDDRLKLMKASMRGLERIFVSGKKYKKAGIIFTGISPKSGHIYDLLIDHDQLLVRDNLMNAYEHLNNRFGTRTVTVGIAKLNIAEQYKSPNIFAWDSLLGVH